MPHIRLRSVTEETVAHLSTVLPKELAPMMATSEDNFTIELVATKFFTRGTSSSADPFVEVLWFERGQEVQDASARRITELVQEQTKADYVSVVFTALPKTCYYENGNHF